MRLGGLGCVGQSIFGDGRKAGSSPRHSPGFGMTDS
jgi:hypothetical protein